MIIKFIPDGGQIEANSMEGLKAEWNKAQKKPKIT